MCLNYGYTLDYCLDELDIETVQWLYIEALRWKGVDVDKYNDEPDREQIYKEFGDQIKHPEGVIK